MRRTPALSAAAAAVGLLAGLALEASTGAPRAEPRPHVIQISWRPAGDGIPVGMDESLAEQHHAEHAVLSDERCSRKADAAEPGFRRS